MTRNLIFFLLNLAIKMGKVPYDHVLEVSVVRLAQRRSRSCSHDSLARGNLRLLGEHLLAV